MPSPTRSRVRPTASGFSPSVAAQFQQVAGPADVDRADLADHLGRDEAHQFRQRRGAVRHADRAASPAGGAASASRRCRCGGTGRAATRHDGVPRRRSGRPGAGRRARRWPGRPVPAGSRRSTARRSPCRPTGRPSPSPVSTSPSITARRSAPAQKCSIASCAASLSARPTGTCRASPPDGAESVLVPSLTRPRTGMTGNRSSSWTEGSASRALARMKAFLKFAMRDRLSSPRRTGCRVARRTRPFPDTPGSRRRGRARRRRTPARRAYAAGSPAPARSATPDRYGRRPREPSITIASAPERTSRLGQHQRRGEADQLRAAVLDRAAPRRPAECRRPARRG